MVISFFSGGFPAILLNRKCVIQDAHNHDLYFHRMTKVAEEEAIHYHIKRINFN